MSHKKHSTDLPPLVQRVLQAMATEGPKGHAEALAALCERAWLRVPARGIFEPFDNDADMRAISAVARKHLGMDRDRRRLQKTLKAANLPFDQRDPIEIAASAVRATSDTAHYLAGLATALVFVSMRD